MEIQQAIEINTSLLDGTYDHRDEEMEAALKLGIEAMKQVQQVRAYAKELYLPRLPGETVGE